MKTLTAILCALTMLCACSCSYAGPVQSELNAYRCLVPDWSKTSGGSSPVLSPDGKTLFYLVCRDGMGGTEAWIVPNVDSYDPASEPFRDPASPPEPWRLDVKAPDQWVQITEVSDGGYRNADWSPDGKRVAFMLRGRLFVAESIDCQRKKAEVRMVADVKSSAEAGLTSYWVSKRKGDARLDDAKSELANPRWSPDGTRIAFLRTYFGLFHSVCVLDINTGKETIAAQDANDGPKVWGQPWSPDGKYLAYNSIHKLSSGHHIVELGGISVVPAAGGPSRKVIAQANVAYPSWSPRGDRLAFSANEPTKNATSTTWRICVSDTSGAQRKSVSPAVDFQAIMDKLMLTPFRDILLSRYKGFFTPSQVNRMLPMSSSKWPSIVQFAEVRLAAKKAGGKAYRAAEQLARDFERTGNLDAKRLGGVMAKLPGAARDGAIKQADKISRTLVSATGAALVQYTWDIEPMWSPDGATIAYVRARMIGGQAQLMTTRLSDGATHVLFDSATVSGHTWTRDGKSLLLQTNRNLAYKPLQEDQSYFTTVPSYPEIWLVDLK